MERLARVTQMVAHLSVEEGKCRLKLDLRLSYAQRAASD
jgi:hypothetical protein